MKTHTSAAVTSIDPISRNYGQMTTYFDRKHELVWCYFNPEARACFTPELLKQLNDWRTRMQQIADDDGIKYHVIASRVPGVFNLGGDLDLFRRLAISGDREGLLGYGNTCIDVLYANISHFDRDVTTISLVQGEALGGGFESALSSEIIIAEKSARMGFPEILFNLFPGMGAYNLLVRKLNPKQAERMILSGKIYTAQELFDMGLVDILVEDGEGEEAVYNYIKRENHSRNGYRALRKARDDLNPVTYEDLRHVVEIWVDAVLKIDQRDLRMMERLVSRQNHQAAEAA
ncbi:crotonase/enoyl-CoA hydratase family protein [uncultured Thiocystis sp.]|jgi:DSF synthase|uniref:crotonase/enoyl-CoA hydratase family protein n=1 Tax=uncultured Thiocystis sp. TaxID=1202134 RepID=UPI0025D0C4CD|nr:crotonase/enoyl-CoA hydratase family protein [uncultured Thiocystis sp.]